MEHFNSELRLVFLITSFGRPFSLEIRGVSYDCLDTGHIAKNCKSTYLCRKCKTGKHHISICESASVDPPGMNREEDKNITTYVTTNDNEGIFVHASCDKNGILLQTARASILPVHDSAQVQTRILFDGSSQRSYIYI